MHITDVIVSDPGVLNGTPVFKGTRVAIQTLFDYLEESSLEEFLKGFPSVNRQQAEAVITFAGKLVNTVSLQYEDTTG